MLVFEDEQSGLLDEVWDVLQPKAIFLPHAQLLIGRVHASSATRIDHLAGEWSHRLELITAGLALEFVNRHGLYSI